jgi:hypothetical protein
VTKTTAAEKGDVVTNLIMPEMPQLCEDYLVIDWPIVDMVYVLDAPFPIATYQSSRRPDGRPV